MKSVAIETPRLILRTVTLADVAGVSSSWNLDDKPLPIPEAEEKVMWMLSNHANNQPGRIAHLCLAILIKETSEFIGWCGLDHLDKTQADPALFYLLKVKYWGNGFATEAARGLLHYSFTELDLPSIHGGAAPENIASKRVMEKVGMEYIGLDDTGGHAFHMTRDQNRATVQKDNISVGTGQCEQ